MRPKTKDEIAGQTQRRWRINVMLTLEEKVKLQELMTKERMSASELIRTRLFGPEK